MKKMKKIIISVVIVLLSIIVYAGTVTYDLKGKWTAYKKTLKDGSTGENITLNGTLFKANMDLYFRDDISVEVLEGQYRVDVKYKRYNDTLEMGNRKYLIEKLNDEFLTLLEIDKTLNSDIVFRLFFKRIEK